MSRTTLMIASIAGTAGIAAAEPQFVSLKHAEKSAVQVRLNDGTTFTPGSGTRVRDTLVPYDTLTLENAGFGINVPYAAGGSYTTPNPGGSESFAFIPVGTIPGATFAPFFNGSAEAPTFLDDNGTPTNPNDDFEFFTDVIFDEFASDPSIWPGDENDLQLLTEIGFACIVANTAFDDNFTPTNPNDDFPVPRVNTAVFNFFPINDNGTPTNPNDDFIDEPIGFSADFAFGVLQASMFTFTVDLSTAPDGGILVPGIGILGFDWDNAAGMGHPSGDTGTTAPIAGGDWDASNGRPFGIDNVRLPLSSTLIDVADMSQISLSDWIWASSTTVDPSADGNPGDTTYTDVLLGGFAVDWNFTDSSLPGGVWDLPHQMPIKMTIEADAAGCAPDLTGASDPNDPSYGVPDGNLDASDFFYFLDQFSASNLAVADLTGSSDPNDPAYGQPDGLIDASDFFFYLDLFVAGCP